MSQNKRIRRRGWGERRRRDQPENIGAQPVDTDNTMGTGLGWGEGGAGGGGDREEKLEELNSINNKNLKE